MFNSQDRKIHFGLLIARLGLTAVLFLHALPKLFAGAHPCKNIGTTSGFINMGLPPMMFGFAYCLLKLWVRSDLFKANTVGRQDKIK